MKRRFVYAFGLATCALAVGCAGSGGPAAAPSPGDRAAVGINNVLALSLDSVSLVHQRRVKAAARAGFAACPPLPQGEACRVQAGRAALDAGQPFADQIDAAKELQHALAAALDARLACAERGDAACLEAQAQAVVERLPKVERAVKVLWLHLDEERQKDAAKEGKPE